MLAVRCPCEGAHGDLQYVRDTEAARWCWSLSVLRGRHTGASRNAGRVHHRPSHRDSQDARHPGDAQACRRQPPRRGSRELRPSHGAVDIQVGGQAAGDGVEVRVAEVLGEAEVEDAIEELKAASLEASAAIGVRLTALLAELARDLFIGAACRAAIIEIPRPRRHVEAHGAGPLLHGKRRGRSLRPWLRRLPENGSRKYCRK